MSSNLKKKFVIYIYSLLNFLGLVLGFCVVFFNKQMYACSRKIQGNSTGTACLSTYRMLNLKNQIKKKQQNKQRLTAALRAPRRKFLKTQQREGKWQLFFSQITGKTEQVHTWPQRTPSTNLEAELTLAANPSLAMTVPGNN